MNKKQTAFLSALLGIGSILMLSFLIVSITKANPDCTVNDNLIITGNVGIGQVSPLAEFVINDNLSSVGGENDSLSVYSDTTDSAIYAQQNGTGYAGYFSGKVGIGGDLEVSGNYLKLPHLTIAERDALSSESGMMIYNTEANEINVFIDTAWKSFGITATAKGSGEPCSDSLSCASGYCVDGVCCNGACGGDCELCNLAGHLGECSTRTIDDNFEITTTCYRCNGTSSTKVASNNDDGINCSEDCTHCSSGSCVNWPNNTQNEECDGICEHCIGGICSNVLINTDPYDDCGGSSCCGYCDGAGTCAYIVDGSTCSSPGTSCTATHYRCNGSGSCTAPKSESCSRHFGYYGTGAVGCPSWGYDGCERGGCYTSCGTCFGCDYKHPTSGFSHWSCFDYVYD